MPRRNKFATVEDVLRDITDPDDVVLHQLIHDVVAMVKKAKQRVDLESDDEQTP